MADQPKLLAIAGPLRGKVFEIDTDELSIGRTDAAGVLIDHKSVSRRHCVFRREGETLQVEDLGSRNGTLVNGEAVRSHLLEHGDRVTVGSSELIVLLHDEDLSSLLSDVRLTEDAFDPVVSFELPREETLYV